MFKRYDRHHDDQQQSDLRDARQAGAGDPRRVIDTARAHAMNSAALMSFSVSISVPG